MRIIYHFFRNFCNDAFVMMHSSQQLVLDSSLFKETVSTARISLLLSLWNKHLRLLLRILLLLLLLLILLLLAGTNSGLFVNQLNVANTLHD